MELGVFIFETPHPLHNVFGISGLLGFFAPLALAITWPGTPDLLALRRASAITAAILIPSIVLNLSPIFIQMSWIVDHYGLVQRTMLVFYFWCAYVALALFQRARQPVHSP